VHPIAAATMKVSVTGRRLGNPNGVAGRRRPRRALDRSQDFRDQTRYTVQCISLGRRDGIIQRVTPDDQVTTTVISGRTAARIKELVCAGAAWTIAHPIMMLPTRRRHLAATGEVETVYWLIE
jgi:hypothetical protein